MLQDVSPGPPEQDSASNRKPLVWGAIVAIVTLIVWWLTHEKRKRIFISFAAENVKFRDYLVRQAEDERSPFTFTDMSLKEPFSNKWKTKCRARIKDCDGMIAMLSKKTWRADGARWEMNCANEEGVPLLGVHIHADNKGAIPPELADNEVIEWTWGGIKEFLDQIPNT